MTSGSLGDELTSDLAFVTSGLVQVDWLEVGTSGDSLILPPTNEKNVDPTPVP